MSANPVLADVTRGPLIESRHRGAAVVVAADRSVLAALGDVEVPVFPRSAVKPLQSLALIESGAADAFALSEAEIAMACASHTGRPKHVRIVTHWLTRIGLGPEALECGAHAPSDPEAADTLVRGGTPIGPVHNNCSGKHAGMLATALHRGEPLEGYVERGHPVQRRIRTILGEMGGFDAEGAASAVDGCSIPTVAMPLTALARAMARLVRPDGLPTARAAAARRIVRAMSSHPDLVAGPGLFDTEAMRAGEGALILKRGAEGIQVAALPERGIAMALKIDDGARRAADAATAALLLEFTSPAPALRRVLERFAHQTLVNWNGTAVGRVEAVRHP